MRASFVELEPQVYERALVLVDVDGTLVPDGSGILPQEALQMLTAFRAIADVYLCSNALKERTASFAHKAGVGHIDSHHKKPSRRLVEEFVLLPPRIVVIGDKALTDGLFAANIGAEFVMVRRVRGEGESWKGRAGYALDELVRPLLAASMPVFSYLMLMRPTQWLKNVLVFTPLFFAGAAFSFPLLMQALTAFVAFSLAASAMYILNDYQDRTADALHPTKRFRPLARGAIGGRAALTLMCVLALLSVIFATLIPALLLPLLGYVVLNTAYSLMLKQIPVADVASVSMSYVLRVLAGGAATGIFVSPWLISCVFFGALILITGKRRAEFSRSSRRAVLRRYSKRALDMTLLVAALLAVVSYALYAMFAGHGPVVGLSAIVVALAIARLVWLAFTSKDAEYPEVLALKDPFILIFTASWLALMFGVLYL